MVARGWQVGLSEKGKWVCICGDGTVWCLDCVNVSILVVTLYYGCARCYPREKPGKRVHTQGSLCIILKSACESTTTSNLKN